MVIEKIGQDICISIRGKQTYKFNVLEHELYMPSGKRMVHMSKALINATKDNNGQELVISAIKSSMEGYHSYLHVIELFITNLDLIESCSWWNLPTELPKGYIKWLRANSRKLSKNSLRDFKAEEIRKTWIKEDRDFFQFLLDFYEDINNIKVSVFASLDTPLKRQVFRNMFKSAQKEFSWNFSYDYDTFVRKFADAPENWYEIVDTNRGFDYNINLLTDYKNKERNEKVYAWQQKFKELENIEHENLVVVVPTDVAAFNGESKQQNNCVSYFYHDSMAHHENIIYFIRKKAKPKKSYITNRFDVSRDRTAESRAVNNSGYSDLEVTDLIKEIDKKIKEILNSAE